MSFGKREPLVELMQQTPVSKLQPLLVNMLKGGTADLRQLVAAAGVPRRCCDRSSRLHSEKYYRTVTEEFAATRPAFRWRHLVGLARVTASMHGYDRKDSHGHRAPGYEQACKLLGVRA
jgi:hypothetical protein